MVMVVSGRPLMVLKRPTADGDGDGGDVDGGDGDDDDADDDGVGDDGDGDGDDGDGDGDDGGRERVMMMMMMVMVTTMTLTMTFRVQGQYPSQMGSHVAGSLATWYPGATPHSVLRPRRTTIPSSGTSGVERRRSKSMTSSLSSNNNVGRPMS